MWTQRLMRTAFIFLVVTMTMLANKSEANIRTLWIPLVGTEALVQRTRSLETDGRRLYVRTQHGLYISDDDGSTWRPTNLTDGIGTIAISTDAIYATAYGSERAAYIAPTIEARHGNPYTAPCRQSLQSEWMAANTKDLHTFNKY